MRLVLKITRFTQYLLIYLLALGVFLTIVLLSARQPAHALPEYAGRTGEPCATCHVNPGGGGPRTLRGLLWSARGRPDAIPQLPGMLLAPGINDGQELFEIACAGCHGVRGEGISAMRLSGSGISKAAIRAYILEGIPLRGMPSFQDQFDSQQLEVLVSYLAALASGEIEPPPDQYLLPPPGVKCDRLSPITICGED